jgi:hypothetical protein
MSIAQRKLSVKLRRPVAGEFEMMDKQGLVGWATPLAPGFGLASLARLLGLVESDTCRARKIGQCPGKSLCADCAWSEGPLRAPR